MSKYQRVRPPPQATHPGEKTPLCWMSGRRCRYRCPSCQPVPQDGTGPVIARRRVCRRCEELPDQPLAARGLCRRCYNACRAAGELDDWPRMPTDPVPNARYIPTLVPRRRWNGWGYEVRYEVPS